VPVSVIIVVVTMAMVVVIVASAVFVVILVLPVMMAVVVANFVAIFAAVEVPFPSAVATPVSVLAADRVWTVITEARIVGAVDVAAEPDGSVEPWTSTEEDSAGKPGWTVVAEGGAVVWRVIVVAVWTDGFNADVDGNLYFGSEGGTRCAEKREKDERN